MTDQPRECCATCRFHRMHEREFDKGICLRNPPVPVIGPGMQGSVQPLVSNHSWCGEWKPITEPSRS